MNRPSPLTACSRVAALLALTVLTATPRASAVIRTHTAAPRPPATERVMRVLDHVGATLRETSYRHTLRVHENAGLYQWDCSLMVAWVLARAAPRALGAVGQARPVAVDFVRAIARAPTERPRAGWQRIARVADARPGDVLAWRRPPWFRSRNTGHVAFVVGTPEPYAGGYLVRVADASSYNHEDDSRAGGTGFGTGTLLVLADAATGAPTGYGWAGRYSGGWVVETELVLGRPAE